MRSIINGPFDNVSSTIENIGDVHSIVELCGDVSAIVNMFDDVAPAFVHIFDDCSAIFDTSDDIAPPSSTSSMMSGRSNFQRLATKAASVFGVPSSAALASMPVWFRKKIQAMLRYYITVQ